MQPRKVKGAPAKPANPNRPVQANSARVFRSASGRTFKVGEANPDRKVRVNQNRVVRGRNDPA